MSAAEKTALGETNKKLSENFHGLSKQLEKKNMALLYSEELQ